MQGLDHVIIQHARRSPNCYLHGTIQAIGMTMLRPKDSMAFTEALADLIRL